MSKFLKRKGYKILARNYRCPSGEADLIALDCSTRRRTGAQTIALVEIKTRTSDAYTDPEAAVTADKRRRIRKVAEYYLSRRDAEGFNIRFDIVSIVAPGRGAPSIKHIPGAF